ncbi:MAG TPA: ImmA/IrrE family metallo-endopeptidase [Solirubrobacter sp.]|nr:ImmA/IrrE family metallo-endopeptidase [Solirubrobacter sp.]
MASLDFNRGAKRAREARVALGLDPAAPLDDVLDAVEPRAPVIVAGLPDGVAGAFAAGVLWVNGNQFAPRRRFTLAHEFGHAWIGHDGRLEVDSFETLSGGTSNPLEVQANAFAAEFLMPKAGLDRFEREPTLEDVVALASRYGVSAPAMVIRMEQLKLASPARLARLRREIDEGLHGYLRVEPLGDRLEGIEALPYLSPSLNGSLLEAALRGDASVDPGLAAAIARIMRPGRP